MIGNNETSQTPRFSADMLTKTENAGEEANTMSASKLKHTSPNFGSGNIEKQRDMLLALHLFTERNSVARKIVIGVSSGCGLSA